VPFGLPVDSYRCWLLLLTLPVRWCRLHMLSRCVRGVCNSSNLAAPFGLPVGSRPCCLLLLTWLLLLFLNWACIFHVCICCCCRPTLLAALPLLR
jgi:hypothetical protein